MISTSTTHIRVRLRDHKLLQALVAVGALICMVVTATLRTLRARKPVLLAGRDA